MKYIFLIIGFEMISPTGHASDIFKYNLANGKCESSNGALGLNQVSLQELKSSGNGECADLTKLHTHYSEVGGGTIFHWNLRGADLNGAIIENLSLDSADFRGTRWRA